MKPFPVHMPFQSVLRLPFMRDDYESRNKEDCSYLVSSLNEQWRQTLSPHDLCQLYRELLIFILHNASHAIMTTFSNRNNAAVLIIGAGVSNMVGVTEYIFVSSIM
jgi:hypothetical protein